MVKTDSRQLKFLNEDTVELRYHDNITIELKDVINDYLVYDDFTNKKAVKKLIIAGMHTSITNDARVAIKEENLKRASFIKAEAIVIDSLAQRMFGNFYLRMMRNKYPIKIFTSVEDARNWLEQF